MNSHTKDMLVKLIDQLSIQAQGIVHMTGVKSTTDMIDACEELRVALERDETIKESR